jgi:polyhydroxybutyrate depolymerase
MASIKTICIDTGRIFSMGHSAGGFISNVLGCIRSNVLRGIGPFAGGGPDEYGGVTCGGKVAAFIGHNPKEGDATECAYAGGCAWVVQWADTGWPSTQFWTNKNGCGSAGTMPTTPYCSDPPTSPVADPTTCCKTYSGCSSGYPVTLCLYDHYDQYDGPHAFPESWGAKAVTDFFLALPRM